MFETLPAKLRSYKLDADVRTLLTLYKAIDKGLVKTLGDMFLVLKGIVVKQPDAIGPFTRAYYDYFLNIDIKNGETLNDAILRSETFKKWKENNFDAIEDLNTESLIDKFLDDVHLTSYDISKIIDGNDLFNKTDADLEDQESIAAQEKRLLEEMADYSNMSLEELLKRLEEIAKQQKSKHNGGSHWIGTSGISPFGHGGAAKQGIRIGGTGGGKMARKILNDRKFFPIDLDTLVNDNNIDAALASLKGVIQESAIEKLDVKSTIKEGLKRGGLFIPEIKNLNEQKLQVILLIDNGGYSMDPYVKTVRTLFKKMKIRFAHDLESYYFHNTIYDKVFHDARRTKAFPIASLLKKDSNYNVFIIGDASMGAYEINKQSIRSYKALRKKFKKIAWLNPEPLKYWNHTHSIGFLGQLIDMYPLTPNGIEEAVLAMNKINS